MEPREDTSTHEGEGTDSRVTIRLPGFVVHRDIGLGDAVRRVTSFVGARPCAPCEKRAAILNSWATISGVSRRST